MKVTRIALLTTIQSVAITMVAVGSVSAQCDCLANAPNLQRQSIQRHAIVLRSNLKNMEPIRDTQRMLGHGWGRSVHYRDPGYHSCYYNPWSQFNTPRFAFTQGEPDCFGGCFGGAYRGLGYQSPSDFQNQPGSANYSNGPIREITEPQFPPSEDSGDELAPQSPAEEDGSRLDSSLLNELSALRPQTPTPAKRTSR